MLLLRINLQRLKKDMEELSKIGAKPNDGITRPSFSKEAFEAENLVAKKMRQAGMKVHFDAAGNLIGKWRPQGIDENKPAIVIGSHLDTVINGGMFDGVLGVMAGLECIRTLNEANIKTKHPIEVIAFADEEANYYWGTFGSLAMLGRVIEDDLKIVKSQGVPCLATVLAQVGINPKDIRKAKRNPDEIHSYLELHIEQGGYLDRLKIPIGVVQGIVGIWRFKGVIYGQSGHAGSTPMEKRDDALVRASNLFSQMPNYASVIDKSMVVTVGQVQVLPGTVNVIPNQVNFNMEMRALDMVSLERLKERIDKFLEGHGGLQSGILKPSVLLNPEVQEIIKNVAQLEQIKYSSLPSAAGHDAMVFAMEVPTGMIFVPSIGGKSHCFNESTNWEDIYCGVQVLMGTLLMIDEKDSL